VLGCWREVFVKVEAVDRVLPWRVTPGSVDMRAGALGDAHSAA
jgi:hypothetical protein